MPQYTFQSSENLCDFYLAQAKTSMSNGSLDILSWLLCANQIESIPVPFIGPRREMVSPWCSNALEICRTAGVTELIRVEKFHTPNGECTLDPMLEAKYERFSHDFFSVEREREAVQRVEDIEAFSHQEGLALSVSELDYLHSLSEKIARPLTDTEVYAFAQINSEHCRHKIFNAEFTIDGEKKELSLFDLIRQTSKTSPSQIVSAYSDNVAFVKGAQSVDFFPSGDKNIFSTADRELVVSIKAETHNFPTAVEPFFGASTGTGGEIRDRMAGGQGSVPLTGSAVYMTSYPRLRGEGERPEYERAIPERSWKYQTPAQILVKASNGASDFGNKFGQPLIHGSLFTFETKLEKGVVAFDRCVMLAGGVGTALREHVVKHEPKVGNLVILLGGENYRIGMAGGSVSSMNTGVTSSAVELSAVQRANPEMQKRVSNVVRALTEGAKNPILSIHDHGSGGHVNCFTELLESEGGRILTKELPVGDPSLSQRELLCNESQERMGLLIAPADLQLLLDICKRERCPIHVVGEITGDNRIVFESSEEGAPLDLAVSDLLGDVPPLIREVYSTEPPVTESISVPYVSENFEKTLKQVLSLEGVGCKDWLTNKVDRSVTGRVAQQQCVGPFQLPLANCAVTQMDFSGEHSICSSLGSAPGVGLVNAGAGSRISVSEALLNLVWVPLREGISSLALSANWMWPAGRPGEDARLYSAVQSLSQFAEELGISVPTGKDSLSMTMQYENGESVEAPGTVVVTAVGVSDESHKKVLPVWKGVGESVLLYIDLSSQKTYPLAATALSQVLSTLGGEECADVVSSEKFVRGFALLQELVSEGSVLSGHDVSGGGIIAALLEMAFVSGAGVRIESDTLCAADFFSEKPAVIVEVNADQVENVLGQCETIGLEAFPIGKPLSKRVVEITVKDFSRELPYDSLLSSWLQPSNLLDALQTAPKMAEERKVSLGKSPLQFSIPSGFTPQTIRELLSERRARTSGLKAAIVREQGTNGDREMAFSLYLAGFEVEDITMSDIIERGRDFSDIQFLVFPGGFSYSDVLGSAKGWQAGFRYQERARAALEGFYARSDTLSLGVCNGCQLLVGLGAIGDGKVQLLENLSHKFESAFLGVRVSKSPSVLLKGLEESALGIWIAHGEGRFHFEADSDVSVPLSYVDGSYPQNPNGSERNAAGICSSDGRHLALMPHLERSIINWQWAWDPWEGERAQTTPWFMAFQNALEWFER